MTENDIKANDVGDLAQVIKRFDTMESTFLTLIEETIKSHDFISTADAKELINKKMQGYSPTIDIDTKIKAWSATFESKMASLVTTVTRSLFEQKTLIDQNTRNITTNSQEDAKQQQLISDIGGSLKASAESQKRIEKGIDEEREQNETLRGRVLKVEGEVLQLQDIDKRIDKLHDENRVLTESIATINNRNLKRIEEEAKEKEIIKLRNTRISQNIKFLVKWGGGGGSFIGTLLAGLFEIAGR